LKADLCKEDVMKDHLASISGNERLCAPDADQYSEALISDLPSEPEQVIYHCCCSYLLVRESLTLAFAACFGYLKSCSTVCGLSVRAWKGFFFSSVKKRLALITTEKGCW